MLVLREIGAHCGEMLDQAEKMKTEYQDASEMAVHAE